MAVGIHMNLLKDLKRMDGSKFDRIFFWESITEYYVDDIEWDVSSEDY